MRKGTLIGQQRGCLFWFNYHHVNMKDGPRGGTCHSTPKSLVDGRIRMQEIWRMKRCESNGSSVENTRSESRIFS